MPQLSLDPKHTKLIAVGIKNYEHYEYKAREDSLAASTVIKSKVEEAIEGSAARLIQVAKSVLLIPEHNILSVSSADKGLLEQISTFGAGCETFIFYFCGHGISHNSTLYLGLDGLRAGNPALSSVTMNEVTEQMGKLGTKNNIVILDCCQSGSGLGALTDEKADESRIRHGMNHNGTFGISGSVASQKTVVDFNLKQSAFTCALCDVLEFGLEKLKMELTLDDVYRGVRNLCAERGLPRPLRVSSIDDTDFIFCKNSSLWTKDRPVFAETIILSKVAEFDKKLPQFEADIKVIDRNLTSIESRLLALQNDVPGRFDRLWRLGNELAKHIENSVDQKNSSTVNKIDALNQEVGDLKENKISSIDKKIISQSRWIRVLLVAVASWGALMIWHFRHLGGPDAWLAYLLR